MSFTLRTYCTGGDLFGTAAAAAGWRVVDGYEIDPAKAAVAQLNGHDVRVADVTRMEFDSLSPVWHEHTSPSCKTASQANTDGGETLDDLAVADAMCRAIHAHAARGGRSWSLENVWGYRSYESFARILTALTTAGFVYTFEHINMADFGVPQTRKRLILWAVRKGWRDRVPALHPTHRKGGDMFSPAWIGWLEAIADLVPGLPDTTPAPWQLLRLPGELQQSLLLSAVNADGTTLPRSGHEPSFTVQASAAKQWPRAYLLESKNTGQEWGKGYRDEAEPSVTVVADPKPSHRPIAYVGVWKRLTLQCLARFQTVPDSYKGLTAEINGNGVPCLFARQLMEAVR